jgi:hypothetical protein
MQVPGFAPLPGHKNDMDSNQCIDFFCLGLGANPGSFSFYFHLFFLTFLLSYNNCQTKHVLDNMSINLKGHFSNSVLENVVFTRALLGSHMAANP